MLQNDFGSNMKILQRYPPVDVQALLSKATELKEGQEPPSDPSLPEDSSWPMEEDCEANR